MLLTISQSKPKEMQQILTFEKQKQRNFGNFAWKLKQFSRAETTWQKNNQQQFW